MDDCQFAYFTKLKKKTLFLLLWLNFHIFTFVPNYLNEGYNYYFHFFILFLVTFFFILITCMNVLITCYLIFLLHNVFIYIFLDEGFGCTFFFVIINFFTFINFNHAYNTFACCVLRFLKKTLW